MRCPKCSYISFDHLLSCAKCGRDLSSIVDQLHGSSVQGEVPQFLDTALADLAGALSSSKNVDKKDDEFRFAEDIVKLDLGDDNFEKAVSLGPLDDETGGGLEQAAGDETHQSKEAVDLNFADTDEFDIQVEAARTVDHGQVEPKETPERGEKKEGGSAAGDTLTLESIDLSCLPPETDAEGQKSTLDFQGDPPDLWTLNASAADEDTVLDKVSFDIVEALELAGQSEDGKSQAKMKTPDSESSKSHEKMGREKIEVGEDTDVVLNKVHTEILNILKKEKNFSIN